MQGLQKVPCQNRMFRGVCDMKKYVHKIRDMVKNAAGNIGDGIFNKKIDALNMTALNYMQFSPSQLWGDIMEVLECSRDYARAMAASHCNMVSTWALIFVQEKTEMSYADFFKWCLESNYCDQYGYLKIGKGQLLKKLGIDFEVEYYYDYNLLSNAKGLKDGFYQMRIQGHFMACYVHNNKVYLSDTASRGQGTLAEKVIKKSEFLWLLDFNLIEV